MNKALEAVAKAIMNARGGCDVTDWREAEWNPSVAQAIKEARAAIAAYEAETGWVGVPRKTLDSLYNEMAHNSRPDYIKCAGYVAELKIAAAAPSPEQETRP
jgi:hypothetical protein